MPQPPAPVGPARGSGLRPWAFSPEPDELPRLDGRECRLHTSDLFRLGGNVMLLAAWALHSIRLAAALGMAIVAMQAPAVTREYQFALLQLVRGSGEDIAQREASARRFYGISTENEERFIAGLRAVEPSNAETLAGALAREKSLHASYDRIEGDPDLLRPIAAARDVFGDDSGTRRQIAQTVLESFAPQLDLSFAAATYGLAGLFLGSLIGELATAALLPRRRVAE